MHYGTKGWIIQELKTKHGINKHPQGQDSLKKYKASELFTILIKLENK